jgi:hypothetical protein
MRDPSDGEKLHRGRFLFCPTKSTFSIFWSAKIVYFCEAATETANKNLGTTPLTTETATCHFFTKFLPLKRKVHFPFSEYQNRFFF